MTTEADNEDQPQRFDVAVTFAGEDRALVTRMVDRLKESDVSVFYDEDFKAETWGADLIEFFERVYKQEARYAVMFVSQHYVEKHWTRVERRAAQERALTQAAPYILPVRLDQTDVPGLPSTTGYLDARIEGVEGIVRVLLEKLGSDRTVPASYVGDVPKTPEDFASLLEFRPAGWEYLLFAGWLRDGLSQHESLYRDSVLRYGEPTGRVIRGRDAAQYLNDQAIRMIHLGESVETILALEAQTAAFGEVGEPGDPDRIAHLAGRVISTYEQLLSLASELRGNVYGNEHFTAAADVLARVVDQPVDSTRRAIDGLCDLLVDAPARLNAGENIHMSLPLTWEVPDSLMDGWADLVRRGLDQDEG